MKAIVVSLLCLTSSTECARTQERHVSGKYRNPALGYSIRIPSGLSATAGVPSGSERGVQISLPTGGAISVWGEPNSLEWKGPSDGVQWKLDNGECNSAEAKPSPVLTGHAKGAQGRVACGDQVEITLLAFRSGGGPTYSFVLKTSRASEREDDAVLKKIAATFRIIRWE